MGRVARLALGAETKNQLMTPRPPHRHWHRTIRRPSFWLGGFVACFLAWAWWDSHRIDTRVAYAGEDHVGTFLLTGGESVFLFLRDAAGPDKGLYFHRDPSREEAMIVQGFARVMGYHRVSLPNSLIFFSFLAPWLGWLAWRARVERKQQAGHAAGLPPE